MRSRVVAAASVAAVCVLTVLVAWWTHDGLLPSCLGWDDEGVVPAPRSLQGRAVCSQGGFGEPRTVSLLVPALVLLVVALVVWWSRARQEAVAALLALVVLSPALTAAAASALPADCSAGQRQAYGAQGCERDLERR